MTIIKGNGQTVYWKGANVTVLETDSEGRELETQLRGHPDGQMVLELGLQLYITDGKIKQV